MISQTHRLTNKLPGQRYWDRHIHLRIYMQTYFVLNTSLIITVSFISYRQTLRHTKSEGQTYLQRMKFRVRKKWGVEVGTGAGVEVVAGAGTRVEFHYY